MKEKLCFYLKFKTYNPEDFILIEETLKDIFPSHKQQENVSENIKNISEGDEVTSAPYILSKGPIPLPRKKKNFSVTRSHNIHK